jgi:hypothetical protein
MIVGHIMGIPVEETVLQFAGVGAVAVTGFAIAVRTTLDRLRRSGARRSVPR